MKAMLYFVLACLCFRLDNTPGTLLACAFSGLLGWEVGKLEDEIRGLNKIIHGYERAYHKFREDL